MAAAIEDLFTNKRLKRGPKLFFLFLYTPVGLLIFLLRLCISLQLCLASFILPKNTVIRKIALRVLYMVMGIFVVEENREKKDESCDVVVSNHITAFDHLAVSLLVPCVSISVYNFPQTLNYILSYKDLGINQGRSVLKSNIQNYIDKKSGCALLLHPEGATSNGNVALLKYGTWAFESNSSILAVGIKVERIPIIQIAPSITRGSWFSDLFFTLFSPYTVYTIRYIGTFKKDEAESSQMRALRVQKYTAEQMHLEASNFTVSDKLEYIKRLTYEEAISSNPMYSSEINSMAMQVNEVLPYLPLDVIKRDLIQTYSVDLTITNLLEDYVSVPATTVSLGPSSTQEQRFPVLEPRVSKATLETPVNPADTSTDLNTAAKDFGKTAADRIQSFHSRKQSLVASARNKYIAKIKLLEIPKNTSVNTSISNTDVSSSS